MNCCHFSFFHFQPALCNDTFGFSQQGPNLPRLSKCPKVWARGLTAAAMKSCQTSPCPMETNAAVKLFVWRLRSSGTSLVFHSFFHVLEDANLGQEMLPQYKSFWRKTYFEFLPFLQKLLLHWNIHSFLLTSFEKEAFLFELFSVSFQCSCITSLLFVSVYKIWYKSQKDSKW